MTLSADQTEALERISEDTRKAKAWYDTMRTVREREIRRIAAEGGTYREIAELSGVAYQRVAQIVTGKEPPKLNWDAFLEYECPKCGAQPGEQCKDTTSYAHAERHDAAHAVFHEQHPELG